ncbi:hypothetical protein [Clostridium lundense]|uniref:hypothetical protein n=1 Tax=Clostridium lundense TaxID=319475 RepID=UPI0004866DD2|nr:hypothetical protein [Clostridium lundense]
MITIQTNEFIYKPNEICHYGSKAQRIITKNEVVVYQSRSSEVNYRGGSEAIRTNVNCFTNGSLFITNKRVLFISLENGFEIPLKKLTAIQIVKDKIVKNHIVKNGLTFQAYDKDYLIILEKQEYPYKIVNILVE